MKKILIVDDDPVTRQILGTLLRKQYQIVLSSDAMGAFSEARKQQPDLVILDLGLPAGGGFTVLQRLQSMPALAMIPVIVVSAQDRAANEPKALDSGARLFFSKPVQGEELLGAVRSLIGE